MKDKTNYPGKSRKHINILLEPLRGELLTEYVQKVDKKKFPIINLKSRVNEYCSTPIILNAANEILVDQYLKKKISFNSFFSYLSMVLNDRNYKKYAIKEPKNISQIFLIDKWTRDITKQKIKTKKNV